jgi:choline kinase
MEPADAFGEYIGANIIEASAAADLADALKTTWERDSNLYYEDGFQEYANRGGEVRAATIGEVSWVEVDNHEDLTKARDIACRY